MPAAFRQHLSFIPLTPHGGGFGARRAFSMGVAFALAELLTTNGFPISVRSFNPPEADDTTALLLAGALSERRWTAVGGYYHREELRPIRLVKIPPAASAPDDVREFSDENLSRCAADIIVWLSESGSGEDSPPQHEELPSDWVELKADAWCHGIEWLLAKVSSIVDEEYLSTLAEAMRFFSDRIAEPYAGRRLRQLLVASLDTMIEKREPDFSGATGELLAKMAGGLDPAGMEMIWPVLDEGVRRGADPAAFAALRGYLRAWLGRPREALADFAVVKRAGCVRPALFAIGQTQIQLGDIHAALASFDEALAASAPGELFTDIVVGQDAAPEPDRRTWRGVLHTARAYAELQAGRFEEAEQSAHLALAEGGAPVNARVALARAYGEQALQAIPRDRLEGLGLLRKHLAVLEEIYAIEPRQDEIQSALATADFLEDAAEVKRRWQARLSELESRGRPA